MRSQKSTGPFARPHVRSPEVAHVDTGIAVGTLKGLVCVIAAAPLTRKGTDTIYDAFQRVALHDGAAGILVLVDRDQGPPDDRARVALKDFMLRLDERCAGLALCLDGDGFVAATKRSVTNLVVMSLRTPLRVKVLASLVEGTRWLLPLLGDKVLPHSSPLSVAASIDQMRREHVAGLLVVAGFKDGGDPHTPAQG
jgi:hypothetical protein